MKIASTFSFAWTKIGRGEAGLHFIGSLFLLPLEEVAAIQDANLFPLLRIPGLELDLDLDLEVAVAAKANRTL